MDLLKSLERIVDVFPASDAYKYDETPRLIVPEPAENFVVVKPKNVEEISSILKFACENRVPVFVRGGGTGLSGGAVPTKEGIVLSMERMNKIEIDRDNRIAFCEAGATLKQLIDESEKAGLSFPPHPGAETATIGGMIATNAGGVRALKYGTMRNYVLGVEAVMPDGRVIEFGGKVLKNSSGYSLLHLVIGSEGTLCVISKAYIRLFPRLREMVTLAIPFRSFSGAIKSVSAIINSGVVPLAVEFMEDRAVRVGEAVTGKKWVVEEGVAKAHLMVIVENFSEAEEIARMVEKFDAVDTFVAQSRREQRSLLEIRSSIYEGLRDKIIEILDVCIPPAFIPEYVENSNSIASRYGIDLITYGHAGDGNVHQHPMLFEGWQEIYYEFREELFKLARSYGGVISGEHGIGVVKKNELRKLMPEHVELMKEIKRIFDPHGILNPGKVV
jgi:glycolate oxidase